MGGVMIATAVGCAGILGIPGDLEHGPSPVDGGSADALNEAAPVDADLPDRLAAPDADAEPPPLCDVTKEFNAPAPLTSLNTAEDEGAARLSEDELTIYVDAPRVATGPSYNIYFAKRLSLSASFGRLTAFPSVDNSIDTPDNDEYSPNVTTDGLTLLFERKIELTQDSNIYVATRTAKTLPFGPVSSVANLNTPDYEANPFIRGDAKELWHVRKPVPNGPNIDISLARLEPGVGYVIEGPTGTLANVNSPTYDGSPVISKNGLALYFSSDRPGSLAGTNIWVATRGSRGVAFNAPVIVANVSSAANEYPGFISGDGCRLYLVSTRAGGAGGQDIYVATRPR